MAAGLSDIAGVLGAAQGARVRADEPVRLRVLVAPDAPRDAALAVRDALVPEVVTASVEVAALGVAPAGAGLVGADAVVVLAGGLADSAAACARAASRAGVPCAILVDSGLEAPDAASCAAEGDAPVSLVAASDPAALVSALAAWLVAATPKGTALAAAFPFARRAQARSLVSACASSNSGIALLGLVPGADMPVLTASQAAMALEVAAAYGRDGLALRAALVALVVAGGLAWRSVARLLVAGRGGAAARVSRSLVATAGTIASGWAAVAVVERACARDGAAGLAEPAGGHASRGGGAS